MAWNEVVELAELLGIPVGTTITGKECINETHPLAIGVVGGRGGTSFSNSIVNNSDLLIVVGSNTDSANINIWNIPSKNKTIIHIDISEVVVGNNYDSLNLIGDAKITLRTIIGKLRKGKITRTKTFNLDKKEFEKRINKLAEEKKECSKSFTFSQKTLKHSTRGLTPNR